MKTTTTIVLVIIAGIFLLSLTQQQEGVQVKGFYPDNVKNVVNNKCYGCHSVKGQSDDARDALMWDSLPGLKKSHLVATLDEMIEVLEKNEMPPEEAIEKYPQLKLLPEEKKTLMSWAEAKADSLLK